MASLQGARRRFRGLFAARARRRLLESGRETEIARSDWAESLVSPTEFYERCFRYFHFRLPSELRLHRAYFEEDGRGFGEAAFHVMWFLLFQELKPGRFLEIGVYRGQVLSLAAMLQRQAAIPGSVVGISPFDGTSDSLCGYRQDVDYLADTLANFDRFGLPAPELVTAYSTDERALDVIAGAEWDCVYIDGNHDYDIVRRDWGNCAKHVRPGGVIVLDDAGLTTRFAAPPFATRGLPGPSQLAAEVEVGRPRYVEILQVGHNRVFQRAA